MTPDNQGKYKNTKKMSKTSQTSQNLILAWYNIINRTSLTQSYDHDMRKHSVNKAAFGPYSPKEFQQTKLALIEEAEEYRKNDLCHTNDYYNEAVERYRDFIHFFNEQAAGSLTEQQVLQMDLDRRLLHTQLMEFGSLFGKTGAEVMTDVIARKKNLAEYGLPEFTLTNSTGLDDLILAHLGNRPERVRGTPWEIFGVKDVETIHGGIGTHQLVICFVSTAERSVEILENGTIHVNRAHYVRMDGFGDIERIRRAARLARDLGLPLVEHHDSTHTSASTTYGVVIEPEQLEHVARHISSNLDQYGIKVEQMDPEIIKSDWNDFQLYLDQHVGKAEEPNRIIYDHEYRKMFDKTYTKTYQEFLKEHGWSDRQLQEWNDEKNMDTEQHEGESLSYKEYGRQTIR